MSKQAKRAGEAKVMIPPNLVARVNALIERGIYVTLSDFVREAVREKLDREEKR